VKSTARAGQGMGSDNGRLSEVMRAAASQGPDLQSTANSAGGVRFRSGSEMSAFPPKADILRIEFNVC
jgi:hypothetical protein